MPEEAISTLDGISKTVDNAVSALEDAQKHLRIATDLVDALHSITNFVPVSSQVFDICQKAIRKAKDDLAAL